MNDLISIVVPIYNVEKYLSRCVKSIIEQTYKNLEIILVDDGSTDRSGPICDLWSSKDERIHNFHKKNGGLSDARNFGMRFAKGKYISFIDSDDYVDIRFIEVLYKTIITTGTNISAIGFQTFSDTKDPILTMEIDSCTEKIEREAAIAYLFTDEKYANYAWNKLYLRSLFEDIKYPFGRKMEDLGTTYKLLEKCDYISYNSERLYFYYQRDNSILHNMDSRFFEDKYILSKQRYLDIKEKFPNMKVNYSFYFGVVLEAYPYLSTVEMQESKIEMRRIWKIVKEGCSKKKVIKFFLLKYFSKLYIKVLGKC